MALADKKYNALYDRTEGEELRLKNNFDDGHINTLLDLSDSGYRPEFGALIYQIQQMQKELDEIRRHVKDDVVGTQGPKGDKGDTGATGARGATGATGPAGPAGADGKDANVDVTKFDMSKFNASSLPIKKPKGTGLLYNDRGIVKVS